MSKNPAASDIMKSDIEDILHDGIRDVFRRMFISAQQMEQEDKATMYFKTFVQFCSIVPMLWPVKEQQVMALIEEILEQRITIYEK